MIRINSFLKYFLLLLLSLGVNNSYAQESIVKGTVTDSLKKPIEACNVSIQGEANGTITDSRGRYTLKVKIGRAHV